MPPPPSGPATQTHGIMSMENTVIEMQEFIHWVCTMTLDYQRRVIWWFSARLLDYSAGLFVDSENVVNRKRPPAGMASVRIIFNLKMQISVYVESQLWHWQKRWCANYQPSCWYLVASNKNLIAGCICCYWLWVNVISNSQTRQLTN